MQSAISAHYHQALAKEGFTARSLESLHRRLATIICTQNLCLARGRELNLILGPRTQIAILINHLNIDKGSILAFVIGCEANVIWLTCSLDDLRANLLAILS